MLLKPFFVLGLALGYVLGARAGRERYEAIVAIARRVVGSQTVQATAGVVQAQMDEATERFKGRLSAHLPKGIYQNTHKASHTADGRVNG